MLKKLNVRDVSMQFSDKDFRLTKKKVGSKLQSFLFQEEAVRQLRQVLVNPQVYRHFIISGNEGLGKKTLLREVLEKYTDQKLPVIYDFYPNFSSLFGFQSGKDFVPGNLEKARGGFLVLPVQRFLQETYLYDFLRVSLYNQKIEFRYMPEALFFRDIDRTAEIGIDVRVVFLAEDYQFERLLRWDSRLGEIFKIKIDLEFEAELNSFHISRFSELIDHLSSHFLRPVSIGGKKRLLEEALVLNESRHKFSLNLSDIKAILAEATTLPGYGKKDIGEPEIENAILSIQNRFSMPKRKYFEALKSQVYNLSFKGSRLGRINGLSIFTPYVSFQEYGQVNVVSARAIMGTGNFINIEREVNLSGDMHDKGVFVLQSYLKGLFSRFPSFGVDISILFEQNNSPIDGDSATMAELLASFSALSELEIPSEIAITGSMSQYGESLPVGATNQKVEAWYEISKLMGNRKSIYKVFVPRANEKDLILSRPIQKSMQKGEFEVHTYAHVSDLIKDIFGVEMGKLEKDGKYTKDSLLRRIEDRMDKEKRY